MIRYISSPKCQKLRAHTSHTPSSPGCLLGVTDAVIVSLLSSVFFFLSVRSPKGEDHFLSSTRQQSIISCFDFERLAADCDVNVERGLLTLLEPQSRFGGKPLKFQVVCHQTGTAVLKATSIGFTVAFLAEHKLLVVESCNSQKYQPEFLSSRFLSTCRLLYCTRDLGNLSRIIRGFGVRQWGVLVHIYSTVVLKNVPSSADLVWVVA